MTILRNRSLFPIINSVFLIVFSFLMVAPMIHLLAVSFSEPKYANAMVVGLWPKGFQTDVYREIITTQAIWRSLAISIYITVVGTLISLLLNSTLSYSLSRTFMPGRKLFLKLILLTFIFPIPLIPSYLLVKELGMLDTLWSLMLPGAVAVFYIFILKSFFQGISSELFDAAKMDGSSEIGIYTRMVLPLSKPVLATIALFHAVGQWNSYFNAIIYLRSKSLYPMQVLLRNMIVEDGANSGIDSSFQISTDFTPEMMKAGIVLFATAPILIVYPFLQKYFVKGAMLGSLKE